MTTAPVGVEMSEADLDGLPLEPTDASLNRRHKSTADISPEHEKCVRFDEAATRVNQSDVHQSSEDVFEPSKRLAARTQSDAQGKSCPSLTSETKGAGIGRASLKRLGNFRRSLRQARTFVLP